MAIAEQHIIDATRENAEIYGDQGFTLLTHPEDSGLLIAILYYPTED